jgi:RNA polymerase sigma-70 factor (ECF subfamily)
LAQVYQSYHAAIYRYIYHHLGDAQTAQDLASDVFRRFLQALRNGGGPTRQLQAWLYRVAHNLIVDELRRRKHRDHQSLDDAPGDVCDGASNLDNLVGNAIAMERVRCALLALTDEQRQVIVLKFLQGMSNAETAEITGKTIGAVKSLQHRALDTLRAQLATQSPAVRRLAPEQALASWGN